MKIDILQSNYDSQFIINDTIEQVVCSLSIDTSGDVHNFVKYFFDLMEKHDDCP